MGLDMFHSVNIFVLSGWTDGARYGPFSEYLQVNLINLTSISSVSLQLVGSSSGPTVTSFILQYSTDGITWYYGTAVNYQAHIFATRYGPLVMVYQIFYYFPPNYLKTDLV